MKSFKVCFGTSNGHRFGKNNGKVEYLKGHFWEAILAMWVKFLFDTYDHVDYPHTEFFSIPRGSCAKLQ